MYQYSRAIYRSIKDLIDPYADRRDAARVPPPGARRVRADDGAPRRRIPTTSRSPTGCSSRTSGATSRSPPRRRSPGRCSRASPRPCDFIEEQIEAGAFDGGVARCRATTRKGKPCQRTPLPDREYCPSHQHLERSSRGVVVDKLALAGARLDGAGSRDRMSHDTDKLIRQLSLVAFLMAERGRSPRATSSRTSRATRRCRTRRSRAASTPTAPSCSRSACRCSPSATSSRARSSTRCARSSTSCRRSSSTTRSSRRSRPCSTCSTASSPTPSRSGSRSRTSRSAGRAFLEPPRR